VEVAEAAEVMTEVEEAEAVAEIEEAEEAKPGLKLLNTL
jgi:hypothetical protein